MVTPTGVIKLDEHFSSPQRAVDTIRKMARLGGLVLDNTTPMVDSYLAKGIRISAIIPPNVDKDAGAVFSLRRQRMTKVSREQLLEWGTATNEMLDFLELCVNHGVSVALAGRTSSGKTTDISFLLGSLGNNKRVFTIEETRELDLVRTDETGRVLNRVIHVCTKDMQEALRKAVRFSPDVIVPAEMRGAEAMIALEAARTGHTVVTSLHANSAYGAYGRILTMCQMSGTTNPVHVLMNMIMEAFPIMVFKKWLPDGTRKMMEIVEAKDDWDGKPHVTPL